MQRVKAHNNADYDEPSTADAWLRFGNIELERFRKKTYELGRRNE